MGTRPVRRGEVAKRVSDAVRAYREARRWSLGDLSKELSATGHPLYPSALSKIESGDRRVDVEDLVAFSKVFGVQPDDILNNRRRVTVHTAFEVNAAAQVTRGEAPQRDQELPREIEVVVSRQAESAAEDTLKTVSAIMTETFAPITNELTRSVEAIKKQYAELAETMRPIKEQHAKTMAILEARGYWGDEAAQDRFIERFGGDMPLGEAARILLAEEAAQNSGSSSTDSTAAATDETRRRPK